MAGKGDERKNDLSKNQNQTKRAAEKSTLALHFVRRPVVFFSVSLDRSDGSGATTGTARETGRTRMSAVSELARLSFLRPGWLYRRGNVC